MASVHKTPAGAWRAKWRDPDGRQVSKTFRTQREAKKHANKMEASKGTGTYVDERAGEVPFKEYAEEWLSKLSVRQSTMDTYGAHLRSSIYPPVRNAHAGKRQAL